MEGSPTSRPGRDGCLYSACVRMEARPYLQGFRGRPARRADDPDRVEGRKPPGEDAPVGSSRSPIPDALLKILEAWLPHAGCEHAFPNVYRTAPWTGGSPGYTPLARMKRLGKRAGVGGLHVWRRCGICWATHAEILGPVGSDDPNASFDIRARILKNTLIATPTRPTCGPPSAGIELRPGPRGSGPGGREPIVTPGNNPGDNPGSKASRAKFKALRDQPPPPHPPGADRRPLDGFPAWYAIDRDRVVWSARGHGGFPGPWHPLNTFLRGRHGRRVCVQLTAPDGRQVFRSIAGLYRVAFRAQLPLGRAILPDWFDDEYDDEADAAMPPPAPRVPPPAREVPAVAALPDRRSQPARLDDVQDPHFDPLAIPPARPAARVISPAPHPGGGPEPRRPDGPRVEARPGQARRAPG